MGIDIVCKETLRVILAVSIRKRHWVAGVCGGNADRGVRRSHANADAQRLTGGQIHIIGLAGNCVTLHDSGVSDLQLSAVAGIDINAAAIATGFIILDLAAIEFADRAGTVNIYAAAIAGGRIAGDLSAMHRQRRRLLIQINGASVHAGVSGDLTVIEVEDTVLVNRMHRAALFHGLVAGNLATPHDNLRHLIGISAQADGAAPSACGVIVDLCAAVHIEHAILVIQSDGTTAATAGNFTAGELAAEHVQRAGIEVNAHTAPAGGSALDGAAAPTVTEDKPAAVFDLNLICAIAGVSLAVQAQVKRRAIHHKIAVDGGIVCQVNIGSIVVISNTVRAVPRRIGHIGMAGMIPCTDATATDAMKMRFIRKLYLRLVNDF